MANKSQIQANEIGHVEGCKCVCCRNVNWPKQRSVSTASQLPPVSGCAATLAKLADLLETACRCGRGLGTYYRQECKAAIQEARELAQSHNGADKSPPEL